MLMSWLKSGNVVTRLPSTPGLPNPEDAASPREARTFQAANDYVDIQSESQKQSRKRKRGDYGHYDDESRAKIARYAIDNGVAKASRKFSSLYCRKVSETTVRSMRDQYVKAKKKNGEDTTTLPRSPRGPPLMLGIVDEDVQAWVRRVRIHGGVINARVVQAGAEGIMTKIARQKLTKFGGSVEITKYYARSVLRRMGFVKRKGTKNVKNLPLDFDEIKSAFVEKVSNVVSGHNIPDSLVINWDQTGCQLVPGGQWTMDQCGSQQVTIAGLDDKRQITLLLAVTKSGQLLPPQVIYAGKTNKSLPKNVEFPESWDVTCTENHWSNEDSMLRYIDNIIVPYVNGIRDTLPLSQCDQQAVAIFDVFRAHQCATVIAKLKENGITPLFVPACCTDRLQPLDLSLNKEYKDCLKDCFHDWYTSKIISAFDEDDDTMANVDLKMSTLKPIHANWIITTHGKFEDRRDLVVKGFQLAGLC